VRETCLEKGFRFVAVLVHCFVSKNGDDHVSFSSLILSLCGVHGRERPVWSCGVVKWIGRPLISPSPSPGHRQVTFGRRYEKYVGQSMLNKLIELASRSHCATLMKSMG